MPNRKRYQVARFTEIITTARTIARHPLGITETKGKMRRRGEEKKRMKYAKEKWIDDYDGAPEMKKRKREISYRKIFNRRIAQITF